MGYEIVDEPVAGAKIKVIGVGGGGGNALNGIIAQGIKGNVEYIAVNTDAQALKKFDAENTIQIGRKLTKGLGAGAKPEIGESSAQESKDEIAEKIKDADMVFITAGMGGGTGTGAAPVIAEIARELNKLTIGVVTKPFKFEGIKKMDRAEKGIEALKKNVDALIVIPNQNLIDTEMKNLTMAQAYAISDNVLKTDVIAIAEIITRHDEINVDFADVTTILTNAGQAHIAIGHGEGKDKVQDILNQVVTSSLLETSIAGARRLIVNVTMSPDLTVLDMAELTEAISNAADDGADIIFGNGTDENAKDTMDVTVIAADFTDNAEPAPAKPANPFAKFAPKAAEEEKKADAKADAEAMQKAGVKAADNPNYYDDIFNIFKK
ncbi:MAG: cell division protein FtsZ [Ruminococcus sp.]|jgi:cell division protein FtsZ|nr:cell division protein FtsZ [Ruminococcus sp.]MBQ3936264.1 cell division protein FtsZ [Ruminococcus sp.]MBQ9869817.1 cell division protein FtsZ [Ruminococcus sp.]MCR5480893.1 cell division protein FtsZ [Ruminococcus sp.]